MSDASVSAALRSLVRLVVVEAPAGCGKTFQGAQYASEIAGKIGDKRVLILAHTHAACDVFASRTRGSGGRVDIRTIDSLISEIAGVYHKPLSLPPDTGAWAQSQKDGYGQLAAKVAGLLRASPMIARSLVQRYSVVICDEHQDASADQHTVVMACYEGGASVRIFGDPMQRIFGGKKKSVKVETDERRWEDLKLKANLLEELNEPHRWLNDSEPLGRWILRAREALRSGSPIDLRSSLPLGVSIIAAENQSPRRGGYQLSDGEGRQIRDFVKTTNSLLVLAAYNDTVNALRSFFGRRLPIWEGHMRDSLTTLVDEVRRQTGDAPRIAKALIAFVGDVAKGFSLSAYGNRLLDEIAKGCVAKCTGKPATLQALGRLIIDQPDHKGVAKFLHRLMELIKTDPAFRAVELDCPHELWDAIRLGQFDNMDDGIAEISHRRTHSRPAPPAKAISTVHKAKGLECDNVLIMPCDAQHFGDTTAARSLLYVAMSRAKCSLTFVVSRENPSPLILL